MHLSIFFLIISFCLGPVSHDRNEYQNDERRCDSSNSYFSKSSNIWSPKSSPMWRQRANKLINKISNWVDVIEIAVEKADIKQYDGNKNLRFSVCQLEGKYLPFSFVNWRWYCFWGRQYLSVALSFTFLVCATQRRNRWSIYDLLRARKTKQCPAAVATAAIAWWHWVESWLKQFWPVFFLFFHFAIFVCFSLSCTGYIHTFSAKSV